MITKPRIQEIRRTLTHTKDLVKYGLIPEFVGRLPVISSVNNLSTDDLVRVLTEPKNSLLKQYQGLFGLSQVHYNDYRVWM